MTRKCVNNNKFQDNSNKTYANTDINARRVQKSFIRIFKRLWYGHGVRVVSLWSIKWTNSKPKHDKTDTLCKVYEFCQIFLLKNLVVFIPFSGSFHKLFWSSSFLFHHEMLTLDLLWWWKRLNGKRGYLNPWALIEHHLDLLFLRIFESFQAKISELHFLNSLPASGDKAVTWINILVGKGKCWGHSLHLR